MINITVNGKKFQVAADTTVLQAVLQSGVSSHNKITRNGNVVVSPNMSIVKSGDVITTE